MSQSKTKTILLAGFIAGTLDILVAIFVYAVIMDKATAQQVLQSVASGVFKKEAYSGGWEMALYGLGLHYCIAFAFAIFFFVVFPFVPFLKKNKIVSGLLYGVFVWIVMNLGVLSVVFPNRPPMTWDGVLIGAVILMLMIGLPISIFTNRYYSQKINSQGSALQS